MIPALAAADRLPGGNEPMILDLLSQAYARAGRRAEAASTAQRTQAAAAPRKR